MPPLFIVKEMTQTLGMWATAVKWLNLDSLQAKQGIIMVLLFPFVAFEEALQVTRWKKVQWTALVKEFRVYRTIFFSPFSFIISYKAIPF